MRLSYYTIRATSRRHIFDSLCIPLTCTFVKAVLIRLAARGMRNVFTRDSSSDDIVTVGEWRDLEFSQSSNPVVNLSVAMRGCLGVFFFPKRRTDQLLAHVYVSAALATLIRPWHWSITYRLSAALEARAQVRMTIPRRCPSCLAAFMVLDVGRVIGFHVTLQ